MASASSLIEGGVASESHFQGRRCILCPSLSVKCGLCISFTVKYAWPMCLNHKAGDMASVPVSPSEGRMASMSTVPEKETWLLFLFIY